ncbi:Plant peroxidase [Corchorus olitorius]|uniref:Peroxidase n=1 Tax=Corchorus olitorius TaxID=93759 RepID=A0A1R3GPA2_9ROSI|nr:Plant peroxidase [Corchorus olitorius]
MKMVAAAFAIAIGLILVNLTGALEFGFYKNKCMLTDVEDTVFRVVQRRFRQDPTIAAALVRMHFHDCFVNGCDASILLDGSSSEKTATPNLSVRGYEVIDEAKSILERACEGVVSCADIIAIAARDAVTLSGGGRYNVETGRKDGLESLASKVDLPSPKFSVSQSIDAFEKQGLNVTDMVYLLGGHTIGVTHCSLFRDRLYNFENTTKPDPTMDEALRDKLIEICPQDPSNNTEVNLDQDPSSAFKVDTSFYKQIILRRGILQLDQATAIDPLTKDIVASIANSNDFNFKFGQAMVKMGAIITDSPKEIRKSCSVINSASNNFLF